VLTFNATVLSVPHGFTAREGGTSLGPFSSLNTSFSVGDEAEAVAANLEVVAAGFGYASQRLRTLKQVHGDRLVRAEEVDSDVTEADGLWTDSPSWLLGIRTADCLPILVEDTVQPRVAALHAGWRGVAANIAPKLVAAWKDTPPSALRFAIGPHIQACCFEVAGDLAKRFAAQFGEGAVKQKVGRITIDLAHCVVTSLVESGVDAANVEVLPHCTVCDGRFFSHRRDRGISGRQLSVIARK
jgi:polyphenol oxidase